MTGGKRGVLTITVLACIGLMAYEAQAQRPERGTVRHGAAVFSAGEAYLPFDVAVFSSRGYSGYRERHFYRHGKSNFIRRRHRSFVYYPPRRHSRYCGGYGRHRYHRGRRFYGGRRYHGYRR